MSEVLSAFNSTAGPLPSGVIDFSRSEILLNPALQNILAKDLMVGRKDCGFTPVSG